MKRRVLSLFLALTMLCTLLPQVSLLAHAETLSGTCGAEGDGSNLTCTLDFETRQLTITGNGPMANFDIGGSPWYSYRNAIQNVSLPDGLTSIGANAFFHCIALKSVTIPDSVTSIGLNAFTFCSSLPQITIPDSVTSIGEGAFSCCSALVSVIIPDSVTSIGEKAFERCSSLSSVKISNGVTSIQGWAFYSCAALTSVTIPASVSTIGENAFGWYWNTEANEIQQVDGFTIYGYNGTAAQSYAEENGVTFVALNSGVGNFTDVKPKDWYADAVLWAVDNGITAGVDEHHFAPKQNCTREQVVTFLWAAKGSPEPQSDANPFKDVKKNSWFRKSVLWAVEQGVTGGVDETHFGVGKACDRAQVVMFLWAAAGKPEPETAENKFTDVKKKDYFYSAVLWAVENGVTGGTTPTTFSPKNICTRAQVVTFLYAAYAEK